MKHKHAYTIFLLLIFGSLISSAVSLGFDIHYKSIEDTEDNKTESQKSLKKSWFDRITVSSGVSVCIIGVAVLYALYHAYHNIYLYPSYTSMYEDPSSSTYHKDWPHVKENRERFTTYNNITKAWALFGFTLVCLIMTITALLLHLVKNSKDPNGKKYNDNNITILFGVTSNLFFNIFFGLVIF